MKKHLFGISRKIFHAVFLAAIMFVGNIISDIGTRMGVRSNDTEAKKGDLATYESPAFKVFQVSDASAFGMSPP